MTSSSHKKEFKLSDQVIGQLREILQLSLLTQTNFVDHCRVLRLEESEKTEGTLILSESYVEGWNKMSESFHQQAQEKANQMASTLVEPIPFTEGEDNMVVESDTEVVISRDPATGKLVGTRTTLTTTTDNNKSQN